MFNLLFGGFKIFFKSFVWFRYNLNGETTFVNLDYVKNLVNFSEMPVINKICLKKYFFIISGTTDIAFYRTLRKTWYFYIRFYGIVDSISASFIFFCGGVFFWLHRECNYAWNSFWPVSEGSYRFSDCFDGKMEN